MDQNLENNTNFKDKLISFLSRNKSKIVFLIFTLLSIIIFFSFLNINNKKKNNLISEQFIQAGIYLSSGRKTESTKIYDNIILSKNSFYYQ